MFVFPCELLFLQTLPSRLVDEDLMELHSFPKVAVSGYSAYFGRFPRQKCQNKLSIKLSFLVLYIWVPQDFARSLRIP